ncbi:polymorphic toxin-type HINT domain-containing protein [Streptomyces sp. NPDC057426]|uniref:polymorphic toxin-type HINT domain-containing protein n=1 Tax=Streptomyces sp. NPDC057426 TaxID=3346128 RepID=UPI0036BFD875
MLSTLLAVSLVPAQAWAVPPVDPSTHAVELPDLQKTDPTSPDVAKIEELTSWSGAPADPPAEYNPTAVTPPPQDAGTVSLDQAGDQLVQVEDLPVKIGQATPTAADPAPPAPSGSWDISVEARVATEAAGVDGAIITVTPPATGSTPVDVELDYSTFEDLYGTEWASRLELKQLPECFLTTPELEECTTPVEVPSTNDPATGTVRATVDPAAAQTQGLSTQAGGGSVVLAASDSASGPGGSYRATSLSPSGSWTAGGSGGGFSWSYPLAVPAPPAGPAPKIAFSYSSQSVDGKTSVANSQASWIGDGWDYHPGFVERRYRSCSDDRKNSPNNDNATDRKKSDLCWASDNLVLSLGGSSTELVRDDTTGKWVPANDDGAKVEYLAKDGTAKAKQTGAYSGEYWRVTTRDGTRYHFGRDDVDGNGTRAPTKSAFTVPVYGNHTGEPCHQATYAASSCTQAWRWNLDFVEDIHGNAMIIDWTRETNHYAQNEKFSTPKPYVRGGHPTQILYGLRVGDLEGAPAGKVVFAVDQRCIKEGTTSCSDAEFDSKNYGDKQPWWDTPSTLHCKDSTTKCYVSAPTFWDRLRLTSVTTYGQRTPGSTALSLVDKWNLHQSFPKQRTDTHPPLWLESISRTGFGTTKDGSGKQTSTALPEVSFLPNIEDMPNRVATSASDTTPGFDRLRVETIRTETGGEIYVDYSDPCPVGTSHPAPEANKSRCFPVHWSPDPDLEKPPLEWFNKYVVERIVEKDRATRAPDVVTTYTYDEAGGAAWAKDADEFSKPELRTYSQWRGYGSVTVTRGETANTGGTDATVQSKAVNRYFRGMSGDAGRATVTVKDSTGTETLGEDLPAYQGRVAETITYTKTGGTVHSRQLTWPYAKKTATRVRGNGLPDLNAHRTGTLRTDAIQTVGAGTRTVSTRTTYDDTYGLPVTTYTYSLGTDGTKANESCTTPTYVHNTGKNLIGLPQRVRTTVGSCAVAPLATGNAIISDVRTSYDALNAFGTAPTKGLPFQTDTTDGDGSGWITSARTEYDALGRAVKVTDAKGNSSTTAYSPATGPAFDVTTTNAKGHQTVSTLDPARGTVLSAVDPNNRKTTSTYDDLGRITAVWSPSRQGKLDASVTFGYQISSSKVPAVTTSTLRDNGTYAASVVLYDGLLRPRQSQTEALGGGRIVTDTLYNSSGTVRETRNGYLAKGEPAPEVFVPLSLSEVPNSTETAYDGLGRPVRTTTMYEGDAQHADTVQYGGDWTLARTAMSVDGTTPLSGSRAVRTSTDALGRTVHVQHYTTTNLTGPAPAAVDTRYTYDPRGKLAKVTDHDGNDWTYTYDVRGRLIASADPDMGASSFGYNELDQQIWSKDGRDRAQYTLYDALGRTTELRDDSETGPLVTSWTYDTLPGAKGLPVASTRYNDGTPYTSEVTGYDTEYRPTGSKITIPATSATTGLAGTYAYTNTYTETGKLQSVTLPATPGGLAAEKVITRYSGEGVPLTTSGLAWYTAGTVYSPYGEVLRTVSGDAPRRLWTTNAYDLNTGRLSSTGSHREAAIPNSLISNVTYGYDTVGNVTSIRDEQSATAIDQQCFAYDPMGRLVEAWTGTSGCPKASGAQGAGPTLSQVSPGVNGGGYWQSYEFDAIGNRTKLTDHDLTDTALDDVHTYTYGRTVPGNGTQAPTTAQPHTMTRSDSTVRTAGSQVASTSSYSYDPSGNTTERVIGGDAQALEWDRRNKLTKATGFANGKGALISPSGKCLDVQGASTADGTPIQLYTCHGKAAQQWQMSGGTLKALGKCATVSAMKLVLSACNGGDAQKFTHRPGDNSLFSQLASACVEVPGADYTDGRDLTLAGCDQSDRQKWRPGDTTTYLYDASGNRLIEDNGTTRTLYLGEAEITVNQAGDALDAQRYYTHAGAPTTLRTTGGKTKTTDHKLTVLLSDHHNTSTTAVEQTNNQAITRRAYDPYGNPRGTEPTNWPGRRTFVGTGVDDPTTGLTHIGAREYDATTGRFISADPLIDLTDPLQMNGYTYANGDPVNLADPSGLAACRTPDECGGGTQYGNNTPSKDADKPLNDESWGCNSCDGDSYDDGWWTNSGWSTAPTGPEINKGYMMVFPGIHVPKGWAGASQFKMQLAKQLDEQVGGQFALAKWITAPDDAEHVASFHHFMAIQRFHACAGVSGGCPKSVSSSAMFLSALSQIGPGEGPGGGWGAGLPSAGGKLGNAMAFCPGNSFIADTEVLMADGTTESIEDVQKGDTVLATDPETGETKPERVTAEILGQGAKNLVRITLDGDGGKVAKTAVITATSGHPFWVPELGEWIDATDLTSGDRLRTSAGTYAQVVAVQRWTAENATVYNLTVADLHTYYVLAGEIPVLVHNSNCGIRPHDKARGAAGVDEMTATFEKFYKKSDIYSESYGNGLDLWTPYGRRQVDIAVRNPDGNLHLYEVKVNKSNYTRGQRRKDEWLAKTYGFETSVVRRGTACPICNP